MRRTTARLKPLASAIRPFVAAAALGLLVASCDSPTAVETPRPSGTTSQTQQASLLACPTQETSTATGLISPLLGGSVSVAGTTVRLPAGAVSVPTLLTVTVPRSQYLEVDVSVPGVEHVQFPVPIEISISYARCAASAVDQRTLLGVYIDADSKTILQTLGGTTDPLRRTHSFQTDHLSGYAIAYRSGDPDDEGQGEIEQ